LAASQARASSWKSSTEITQRTYRPLPMSFEAVFPGRLPHVLAAGERAWVVEDDALTHLRDACSDGGPVGEMVVWAWTVDPTRTHTLLVQHPRYQHWMPAGGRCDAHEHPAEAALRDLQEESGLHGRPVRDHPLLLDVVHGERAGAPVRTFGMAFLVEADRSLTLVPEPGQPVAWFPLGPQPPAGASARHWTRLLAGLVRERAHP
jgi:ADP-ribose pyrophosphatase YjhB (NUDIX family)